MALRLHGITAADVQTAEPLWGPTAELALSGPPSIIPYRDLCAIVSDQKNFARREATPEEVEAHRTIIDRAFRQTAVLPAPVGLVFRTKDVLTRWMDLHYIALTGGLEFVGERAAARVHVVRADGKLSDFEAGSDLASGAADAIRALHRRAVAVVPLRLEEITGLVLSAAFLVDRVDWAEFERAVNEQREEHDHMRFEMTGPWAPYDFVRMQFEA